MVFIMCFLVFMLATLGCAEKNLYEEINVLKEFEDWEAEEGDGVEVLDLPSFTKGRGNKVLVNVDSFGAVGDGVADDTKAFSDAWKQACSIPRSVLLVPSEGRYLVNATRFKGPCAGNLIVQIDGTIVAPDEPKNWDPKNPRVWLVFSNLTAVSFQGQGVIDGSGSKWWEASCKRNKSNPCKGAPTAFTIDLSSAIKVKGLTIQNSQQMHFTISRSDSVRDDCVSIVNASSSIRMKNIYCGPGHGISIGSLGKDNSVAVVTKVVLDTAFLRGTTNGLRIKTWQGGSGYVRAIRFQNVMMDDVSNPIIIDQFYCDSPTTCQNQTSAVEISEVVYRNITGTSKSQKAMQFACSNSVPCTNIVLNNINLETRDGTAEVYCNSATGIGYGYIHPSAECLDSSDKEIEQETRGELAEENEEQRLIHTEL
nr:probable polygalacturonase At1g80170 [Ipomoea batatas]